MRAHAHRDLGRVGADDAAAQDDHVARRHAGNAAEQRAAATVGRFEVHRAHLDGQAPRHLAHGSQQRQGAILLAQGLVGDGRHAGSEQAVGQLGQGCQVQVGEQDQAGAQAAVFGRLRLLDLDDQVRVFPDVADGREQLGAGIGVFLVGNRAARAGAGLYQDPVSGLAKRDDRARHQSNSGFVVFDFLGNAYDHLSSRAAELELDG